MTRTRVQFDYADSSDPRFDRPIEWMLIALLAFAPFALGGWQPWSEAVICLIASALAITFMVKLLVRPEVRFVRSAVYIPIVAFLFVAILQLIPLPAALVKLVAPGTFELKTKLLSELPGAVEKLRWMTVSLYPEQTEHDVRLLLAVVAVFVVVVNVFRRQSQIRRLLFQVAIIGMVLAFFALIQTATLSTDLYWFIPMPEGRVARSGPFVNYGHFAQFLNMCMGAALAVLLMMISRQFSRGDYSPSEFAAKLRAHEFRHAWVMVWTIGLCGLAIMLSLSRGGMISAAVAGLITACVLASRQTVGSRGWKYISLAGLLFVLAMTLVPQVVVDRFLSVREVSAHGNRMQILRDQFPAWKQFPILGTGLGTFATVFPMFDHSNIPVLTSHAENEYAQLMFETGAIGVLFAAGFIGFVFMRWLRTIRGRLTASSAMAIGIGYGVIAVAIHSFTDFGQHAPANALLTATMCAVILNLNHLRRRELGLLSEGPLSRGSFRFRVTFAALVLVIAGWQLTGAYTTFAADVAWRNARAIEARLAKNDWTGENDEYARLIFDFAEKAESLRRGNVEYRYWRNVYRWKAITRAKDETSGQILLTDQSVEWARRIVEELHAGRWLCPTFGPIYGLAGQIEHYTLKLPVGASHIELGSQLARYDAFACLRAGKVDARNGRFEDSMVKVRRALVLNHDLRIDAMWFFLKQINRPDYAIEIANDDHDAIRRLIEELARDPALTDSLAVAKQREVELTKSLAAATDAPAGIIARLAELQHERGDLTLAIASYRRALVKQYDQQVWRLALARLLAETEDFVAARREVEVTLRRYPNSAEAIALMKDLQKRATTVPSTKAGT